MLLELHTVIQCTSFHEANQTRSICDLYPPLLRYSTRNGPYPPKAPRRHLLNSIVSHRRASSSYRNAYPHPQSKPSQRYSPIPLAFHEPRDTVIAVFDTSTPETVILRSRNATVGAANGVAASAATPDDAGVGFDFLALVAFASSTAEEGS